MNIEDNLSLSYRGAILIIKDLRPGTVIKDDAIPDLLHRTKQPTFITINHTDFWRRVPASRAYCIVCLKLSTEFVDEIPNWLRRLFKLPEFKSKSARMGKIILASRQRIQYYTAKRQLTHLINWPV